MRLAMMGLLVLAMALGTAPVGARSSPSNSLSAPVERGRVAERKKKSKARKGKGKTKGKAETSEPAAPEPAASEPPATPAKEAAPLPAAPALPDKYKAVAVLPSVIIDADEELVHAVERSLATEIEEHQGMRAISSQDVLNDLATYKLDVAACEDDTSCLARCGRYARAHLAIAPRVAVLGGTINVSIRLVDTVGGRELGRVADPVSDDANERAQELHRMAVQLLAPETYVGTLMINSPVQGADIYLDDKLVGTTPLPGSLNSLPAGPHILRVSKAGFGDLNQFVDVVYKRNSTITVDLAANTIAGLIVEVESKTGFGSLYVACNQDGVELRVDGEPKGLTPLGKPIEKIAAGKRRVSMRKEGLAAYVQEVEIKANRRLDLGVVISGKEITLAKSLEHGIADAVPSTGDLIPVSAAMELSVSAAPQWTPTWRTTTGLVCGGLAVASFSAWSYFGLKVKGYTTDRDDLIASAEGKSLQERDDIQKQLRETNQKGQNAELMGWVSIGAAAGLGLTGGGLVLWDLFRAPDAQAALPATLDSSFALTPLPGGGAFVWSGTW